MSTALAVMVSAISQISCVGRVVAVTAAVVLCLGAGCSRPTPVAPSDTDGTPPASSTPAEPSTTATQSTSPAPRTQAASQAAGQAAAPAAAARPVPAPTAEQLARWTRPHFEPLQLLAHRDSEDIAMIATMDHTPDGRCYVLGGERVTVWTVGGSEPEATLADPAITESGRIISSLAISPDGNWVAAGDTEGRMTIWNLTDNSVIASKQLHGNDIVRIAISPDSRSLATISYDSEVSIWSADSLEPVRKFKVDDNSVSRIEYISPSLLAVAGEKVTAWDPASGTLAHELSPGRYNRLLARSPDNQWFVFGTDQGLSFWNVAESKVTTTAPVVFASEGLLEFSPDGKYLASVSDRAIHIWDIAAQQIVQVIDVLGPPVSGLSWLPGSNLMVVATVTGRVRTWGAPAAGQPLGLQPVHVAAELRDVGSQVPATSAQMLAALDLRSFPRLPGGGGILNDFNMLSYVAEASALEAEQFHRHHFGKDGWTVLPAGPMSMPGSVDFGKQGFVVTARFTPEGDTKTRVDLMQTSNVDLRSVPRIDANSMETIYENSATVLYKAKLDLLEIETTLLRKMHAAGWIPYTRLNSSFPDEADSRDLEFLRNGTMLRVMIQRSQDDPAAYHVQYSDYVTQHSLPIPTDSGLVEFDGSTEPLLAAATAMDFERAGSFYDTELAAQGWMPAGKATNDEGDYRWQFYLRGQQDLTIGLQRLPSGRTMVRVGAELDRASWQLAGLAKPEESDESSDKPSPGVEAADIPILNADGTAKYDAESGRIELRIAGTTLAAVAEKYTAELAKFGFTPESSGIRDEDYTFLTFTKDGAEIQLRAHKRDGNADVSFMGDGLLWTKPLGGAKPIVSYAKWLRQNRHLAGLELLDQYIAEMRALQGAASP